MKENSYNHITYSESTARRYLLGFCFKNYQRFCPKCRYREFYRMSDGRKRCRRCRYTFHDFSGRWIDSGNLSCTQWLKIVKLFEQEFTTRGMSARLGISYDTIYKAVSTIRLAVAAHAGDTAVVPGGGMETDPNRFHEERKKNRRTATAGEPQVFGLREHEGRVHIQTLPDIRSETVMNPAVRKVQWGNIVYTDRYEGYDALICYRYGHARIDRAAAFSKERVYIDGSDDFWSYAKERITKYHGVTPRRFPLYLKELEFRYNHRSEDIFPIIVGFLCDLKV